MLTSLDIVQYRGIKNGKLSGLGAVNLIVGRNGSGKSTILEAIYSASVSFGSNPTLLSQRRNSASYPSENLWYGYDTSKPVQVGLELSGAPATRIGFQVSRTPAQGYQFQSTPDLSKLAPQDVRFFSNVRFLDTTDLLKQTTEQLLYPTAVKSRKDREIAKIIKDVYALDVEGFTFVQENNRLVLKVLFNDRAFTLDLDDLGAGIRIALRLFLWSLSSSGSAILLEEFDAYQHVASLGKLATTMCRIAREQQVQFFLTTHSLDTVREFVEADRKHELGLVRVFQTELLPDGTFTSANLTSDQAGRLMDVGMDLRRG